MVAIVRCTRDEMELREFKKQLGTRYDWDRTVEITRRRDKWGRGSQLALILDPDAGGEQVTHLGWATALKHSGDLDHVLEISRIQQVRPVRYSEIVDRVAKRHLTHLASIFREVDLLA